MTGWAELGQEEAVALERFAEGCSRDEIAAYLGVGPRIAHVHLASACRKLGARNMTHAATLFLVRRGAGEGQPQAV